MLKLLLGVTICLAFISCSKRENEGKLEGNEASLEEDITPDTCSFCSIDSFLIKSSKANVQTKIVIDYPVAIEFFNRTDFVNKTIFDGFKSDTAKYNAQLMNEMHHLQDQSGYYTQGIKPELLKSSVTIIDTLKTVQFIKLTDRDGTYLIDLRQYQRKNDGVLMYNPGKRPIFWTMEKDGEYCFGLFGFPKWYFNCHNSNHCSPSKFFSKVFKKKHAV